jgi:2-methylisocitrate lyase-like PEP mutase family enzyme
LLNIRHTIAGYEAAGVAAIQIEDQETPKKCGHTPGRRAVPLEDMLRTIEVAVVTRRSADFLVVVVVVAGADPRTALGLDEVMRRGRAFASAGADIVFVESPETEDEPARIGAEIEAPLLANMVEGGRTPMLSAARLQELCYTMAIYPAVGFLAVTAALERGYGHTRQTGSSNAYPRPKIMGSAACAT